MSLGALHYVLKAQWRIYTYTTALEVIRRLWGGGEEPTDDNCDDCDGDDTGEAPTSWMK